MASPALLSVGSLDAFKSSNGRLPSGSTASILKREPADTLRALQMRPGKPRQIPDEMWNKHEADIKAYLEDQLQLAEGERGDFVRKLARWKLAYDAPLKEVPKNFPIRNASDLTVPLIKEMVNTLAAQLVQVTFTNRPRWVLEDLAEEWEPFTDEIQDFLDIASDRDLNLDPIGETWVIEATKLGTSILEMGHEVDERKTFRYTHDGKRAFPHLVTHHDGPKAYHIPLQRFWIRFSETDPQAARWCATEIHYNERTLKEKQAQKGWYNIEEVLAHYRQDTDEVTKVEEAAEKTKPSERIEMPIFKIWLSWDIDGDGRMEELLLFYSREAMQFVSRQFNPYWHGKRPFVVLRYFPKEHRFYGEGLCEMLEQIQVAISAVHNRRADNATMANLKMIIKKKLLRSLQPGDPLYTGKIIEANDIWNDMREFSLSEIYPSTVQEELILRQYGERIAGSNDAIGGSAMPVTRTTASAQLALLQEQFKRIDLTIRSVRRSLNEVAQYSLMLYFQYGVNGKGIAWLGERGRVVEAIFRMPSRVIELGMAITATTPTSMQNRQTKRENSLALFNLMVQMYERLLPFVQHLAPESMGQVAHAMVRSAHHFMENTLEAFEETDPDSLLAGLTVLEQVLPAPEDFGGLEAFRRGAESSEIIDKLSRLEDLATRAEEARGRKQGSSDRSGDSRRVASAQGVPPRRPAVPLFGGSSVFGR